MTNSEARVFETEPVATTRGSYAATWRYVGDRAAADLAYCARFGTQEAPEPTRVVGGVWAYALPAPKTS